MCDSARVAEMLIVSENRSLRRRHEIYRLFTSEIPIAITEEQMRE